jgi:uncharacterized metal-binding protein YceD (DUF177 family)
VLLEAYRVNIQGLSNKIHHFDFELGDAFFRRYGTSLVSGGNLKATAALNKHETFIETDFKITGNIVLVCDRSLDPFDFPVDLEKKIIFKFGHEDAEISEDILTISYGTESLELGQFMYEFIGLAVPMKKLHPRFQDVDDRDEIVYSSEEENKTEEPDPRWEILKKLNKK